MASLQESSIQEQMEIQNLHVLLQKQHIQDYIVQQNLLNSSLINLMRGTTSAEVQDEYNATQVPKSGAKKKKLSGKTTMLFQAQNLNEQIQMSEQNVQLHQMIEKQSKPISQKKKTYKKKDKQLNQQTEDNLNFSIHLSDNEVFQSSFSLQSLNIEVPIEEAKEQTNKETTKSQKKVNKEKTQLKNKIATNAQKIIYKSNLPENTGTAVVDNNYSTLDSNHFLADSIIQKKINFCLQTLISENIPNITILERFEIQTRVWQAKIVLNPSNEWLQILNQELSKLTNPKLFTQTKEESILFFEMVEIIYNQREKVEEELVRFCVLQRYKIKVLKIQKLMTDGLTIKDIDIKQLYKYLESFDDLIEEKVPNKAKGRLKENKRHLKKKLIDMYCANVLSLALSDSIGLPQFLKILTVRKSPSAERCIKAHPDLAFLDELIKLTGYEHLKEQFDYEKLEKISFFEIRETITEMKVSKKFATSCFSLCRRVLSFAASQVQKLDQVELRNILNLQSVQTLKQQVQVLFPNQTSTDYKKCQVLPVFVGSIINFFEYYLEQKAAPIEVFSQGDLKISKDLMNTEFSISHEGKLLNLTQQKKCRSIFKAFLNEITSRKVIFPQCLAMFKIKKKKLVLYGNNIRIIGVMMIHKTILSYFINCWKMESPNVRKVTNRKYHIYSVPLLGLQKSENKINLEEVFIKQANLFYDGYGYNSYFDEILQELFNDSDFCSLIQSNKEEIPNPKLRECFQKLKALKCYLVQKNIKQIISE